MQNRVTGVSLMGLIVILVVLAMVALLAMKVIPSYLEFRAARNAIFSIARERPNASPAEVRKTFESRALIDSVESVRPEQLEIGKGSIAFAYRKEVPLFTGVGLYIDYTANTAGQ